MRHLITAIVFSVAAAAGTATRADDLPGRGWIPMARVISDLAHRGYAPIAKIEAEHGVWEVRAFRRETLYISKSTLNRAGSGTPSALRRRAAAALFRSDA